MAQLAIHGGNPVRSEPFHRWPVFDTRDKQALMETLESGKWGIGAKVTERFEQHFADYCGAQFAVSCTNGTDALYIALQAMGIGPGDEVIVPSYTFMATAISVLMVNAIPVFADIDPETYNLDPESVEKQITPKTKAMIPVHIAGNPAEMDELMRIAEEYSLLVLEDCAQAPGAEWNKRKVGTIGHAGTFSFQSSKNLTAGEGGAIITNDESLADRLRTFTNCGRVKGGAWYDHHELGGNHRLGAFQSALLLVGMERLEGQMKQREENARYLQSLLEGIDGVSFQKSYAGCTRHAYHLGILRYQPQRFKGLAKSRFAEALRKEGIDCSTGYLPVYQYNFFQNFPDRMLAYRDLYEGRVNYRSVQCPHCERVCQDEAIWLFQEMLLGSKEDMDDIVEAIVKIQCHVSELFE
ncbi:MAG: DegT/DnrJ/EryC1/StrS family aminotransferase [Candidatus Omnitrophota bacterium]|jgi:dTDP-4-amino-4,6-dideoxygalactose transaminase|nr:MAG: DegT/DnrJ/EryC1/StrS family aminotransferase [Candidatus Omnitrophota bacterium]